MSYFKKKSYWRPIALKNQQMNIYNKATQIYNIIGLKSNESEFFFVELKTSNGIFSQLITMQL